MSSQGPKTGSAPTGVPAGYVWNATSIRDSSDWTTYKKQTLIATFDAAKIKTSTDPWFVHGQGYKLDYLNGKNKAIANPGPDVACTGCEGNAFAEGIDFSS
jgi:hypothetical protein